MQYVALSCAEVCQLQHMPAVSAVTALVTARISSTDASTQVLNQPQDGFVGVAGQLSDCGSRAYCMQFVYNTNCIPATSEHLMEAANSIGLLDSRRACAKPYMRYVRYP
jgi:hypothetical protein